MGLGFQYGLLKTAFSDGAMRCCLVAVVGRTHQQSAGFMSQLVDAATCLLSLNLSANFQILSHFSFQPNVLILVLY